MNDTVNEINTACINDAVEIVSRLKEEFVTAAKKELQPYLTKKDEKQIDTTYDTTYTIDRRH